MGNLLQTVNSTKIKRRLTAMEERFWGPGCKRGGKKRKGKKHK